MRKYLVTLKIGFTHQQRFFTREHVHKYLEAAVEGVLSEDFLDEAKYSALSHIKKSYKDVQDFQAVVINVVTLEE